MKKIFNNYLLWAIIFTILAMLSFVFSPYVICPIIISFSAAYYWCSFIEQQIAKRRKNTDN